MDSPGIAGDGDSTERLPAQMIESSASRALDEIRKRMDKKRIKLLTAIIGCLSFTLDKCGRI
jgi:hypothetical protein